MRDREREIDRERKRKRERDTLPARGIPPVVKRAKSLLKFLSEGHANILRLFFRKDESRRFHRKLATMHLKRRSVSQKKVAVKGLSLIKENKRARARERERARERAGKREIERKREREVEREITQAREST